MKVVRYVVSNLIQHLSTHQCEITMTITGVLDVFLWGDKLTNDPHHHVFQTIPYSYLIQNS